MSQSRPTALAALETAIKTALPAPIAFYRDPDAPVAASHDGVVVMLDGEPGQPEILLSPVSYAFEHQVEFEVIASGDDRAATVEAIIAKFEPALAADRTLGWAVDDARIVEAPEISEIPSDGAETERSAILHVQLCYTSMSAAG